MQFKVGYDRAVTLWGGPCARGDLRARYPKLALDESTYDMAYTEAGVERVAGMGFNRVLLMSCCGRPPESEVVMRDMFQQAVRAYHEAGIQVYGGVEVSSCTAAGSYQAKDWYAVDAWGKRIPRYTGRFYTCWNSESWLEEVKSYLRTVLEAGADGIWFSSPWMGGLPFEVGRGLLGSVGCFDPACRAAYAQASDGMVIPREFSLRSGQSQRYLAWRRDLIAQRLREWGEFARAIHPSLGVVLGDFDISHSNPAVTYGAGLSGLDAGQDGRLVGLRLVGAELPVCSGQNAAVLGSARINQQAESVLGHIKPPTHDLTASGRRFVISMAEACAMGVPPAIDGRDVKLHHRLTLSLHAEFERQQQGIRQANRWMEQHAGWLAERTNNCPLAVYYDDSLLNGDWGTVAPVFWGACQTLIRRGLPFRVVGDTDWDGVTTLIMPPGRAGKVDQSLARFVEAGGRVIALQRARVGSAGRPLWTGYRPVRSSWLHWPLIRRVTYRGGVVGWRLYHTQGLVRFFVRRFERQPASSRDLWQTELPDDLQAELLEAVGRTFAPRADGDGPVLFTMWREPGGVQQWHLVNYLEQPQRVTLRVSGFISAHVYAVGEETPSKVFGNELIVILDDYKVLRFG